MSTVHQYMKSQDPEVIAVVERNERTRAEWKQRLFDWASELTGTPKDELKLTIHGYPTDRHTFHGFSAGQVHGVDLPGRWTKEPVRPYKDNPYMETFQSVNRWRAEPVPGRPGMLLGDRYMGGGTMFVHDGVAYSGIGFTPSDRMKDAEVGRWQEIKGSEFMAACEAYEEERA